MNGSAVIRSHSASSVGGPAAPSTAASTALGIFSPKDARTATAAAAPFSGP